MPYGPEVILTRLVHAVRRRARLACGEPEQMKEPALSSGLLNVKREITRQNYFRDAAAPASSSLALASSALSLG